MSLDPTIIDPVELGLSRLATQYSESIKFKEYLSALLFGLKDLEQAVNDIALKRTIDEAYGVTLDQIGELVGQPRLVLDTADNPFFGFWDGVTANEYLGFGDNTNLSTGGVFYGDGDSDLVNKIDDNEYRTYIRARIARNISKGRASDMLYAFKFILGDATIVNIQDTLPSGNVTIGINRTINDAEQTLLTVSNLSPVPAGVGIQQWYTYIPGRVFGMSDAATGYTPTGSAGFADGSIPTPDGDPRQPWLASSFLYLSWWINPSNGFLYRPQAFSGPPYGRSGPLEPKWKNADEIDLRYPWSPGYGYGVTLDIEGMPDWLPTTVYPVDKFVFPSNGFAGLVYKSSGGTTGLLPPSWPTTAGATVSDGSVTWTAHGMLHYDSAIPDPRGGGIFASGFE